MPLPFRGSITWEFNDLFDNWFVAGRPVVDPLFVTRPKVAKFPRGSGACG